jgi:hypothetical protein
MKIVKTVLIIAFFFLVCSDQLYAGNKEVILADFEDSIPCSDARDSIGFRKKDTERAVIAQEGAEGSRRSVVFKLSPHDKNDPATRDLFFQGKVRRMYLATKRAEYDERGPNALSFYMKLKSDSVFISKEKKNTFGIWTYHWEFGDENVGGKSNKGLATDSMMHGYSNLSFTEKAAGKWVRVILTPSAFQQSRYYYHFYAARATTDHLQFFPSLRQMQFHIFPDIQKEENVQIDQLKLIYLSPTAVFEKDFFYAKVSKDSGDYGIPVVIKNPTRKNRAYRVFISSFLGVHRNVLYGAHTLTDSFTPPRMMQAEAGGDGGIGVVELIDEHGDSIIEKSKEISIPAGEIWKGKLVHHVKPQMLGQKKTVNSNDYAFSVRRSTLTTSVIVWDPYDETVKDMEYIEVLPSNADDGSHQAPPGFPEQKRPPEGWRSEDIAINQVGGYFVSVIQLTE